ncbi:zinc-binding dehydrogenase [Streptomyces sp. NPDC007346]|uniref:zinc-binding dehydrogenase n=1 Tax=Streptomyces sp. NPDC007346 TaxID=3154682 RepID=UPI003451A991
MRGRPGPAARGIRVCPVTVTVTDGITDTERLDTLRRQAGEGVLTPHVADVLPADRAAEAHRRLEAGGLRGRLVLDFSAAFPP